VNDAASYQILGLTPDASFAEIQRAYHELTQNSLPEDESFGDSEAAQNASGELQAIHQAYAKLVQAHTTPGDEKFKDTPRGEAKSND
jgi:DnaJ-class molecular chaperone